MAAIALEVIPADRPVRILDLGCGTGSLVFRLAAARPLASVVGLDISAANIAAAEQVRRTSTVACRVSFAHADYRAYDAEPFDAIVSDGVLHLIPGDTRTLFEKIAGDLRPGGVFVCAMPYDCLYNRVFALVRRGLRSVRSRATDALILLVARGLHGHEMDEPALRERIDYMYLPPKRMLDGAIRDQVAPAAGLRAIARHAMASTSLSQLRHDVTIFQRTSGNA
jgi:SAM-dependent methyltransferase